MNSVTLNNLKWSHFQIIVSVLEARDCLSLDADDFSLEDNEFLDRRSSVNWKDGEAMSPLHWAATSGK